MLFLGISDAVLVYFFGVDGSISHWMQNTSLDAPLFVIMLGFLLGHFFSGANSANRTDKNEKL